MRIAVLSDIHANVEALEAVYMDAVDQEIEQFWFLGDAVGYGPDPIPALLWVANFVDDDKWVLGNHEAILARLLTAEEQAAVGETAESVVQHHRDLLRDSEDALAFWQRELIAERAKPRIDVIDGWQHTLTHAGQTNRHLFRYLYAWRTDFYLPPEFDWMRDQHSQSGLPQIEWVGHTHVPMLICGEKDRDAPYSADKLLPNRPIPLQGDCFLINPGAVGQPRDLDKRASYMIWDSTDATITLRRVAYDWQSTLAKLYAMPVKQSVIENLANRLSQAPPTKSPQTPQVWLDHYQLALGY